MKYETIDREQIDDIMNGRDPRPPKDTNRPSGSASSGAESDDTEAEGGDVGKPASEH